MARRVCLTLKEGEDWIPRGLIKKARLEPQKEIFEEGAKIGRIPP